MLLRSMGPQVIAVDEIGRIEEIQAITAIVNSESSFSVPFMETASMTFK